MPELIILKKRKHDDAQFYLKDQQLKIPDRLFVVVALVVGGQKSRKDGIESFRWFSIA